MKLVRGGQRTGVLLEQTAKTLVGRQQKDLHTSEPVQGSLTMPDRLVDIPEAQVGIINHQMPIAHNLYDPSLILGSGIF